jgi:hypothetical protein
MKKFVIYTYPFSFGIGGVQFLHKLCDILNNLGYSAYLYPQPFPNQIDSSFFINESYNTPLVTQDILNNIDECIVIYPEIIKGNPLMAKNVVRWILNLSTSYNKTYGTNDIIFYHSKLFYDDSLKQYDNNLSIIEYHSKIFKNYNIPRKNDCYCVRKCPNPKFNHPLNAIEITWADSSNLEYLVNIFNTTNNFYCYDDTTFLAVQAAMCGCVPIIIPYRYTKDEWYNAHDINKYGMAYGNEKNEIEHAVNSRHVLLEYIKKNETDLTQIQNFVSVCLK